MLCNSDITMVLLTHMYNLLAYWISNVLCATEWSELTSCSWLP